MHPAGSIKVMVLFATSKYLSRDPKDRVMKEESIVDNEMSSRKVSIILSCYQSYFS